MTSYYTKMGGDGGGGHDAETEHTKERKGVEREGRHLKLLWMTYFWCELILPLLAETPTTPIIMSLKGIKEAKALFSYCKQPHWTRNQSMEAVSRSSVII